MTDPAKIKTLFDAYLQSREAASGCTLQEAFAAGYAARGLEPEAVDERVYDSLLHTLCRRNPARAKMIIGKLSQK